jgi:RNA polymerase sigma factor (sigma-70 family)
MARSAEDIVDRCLRGDARAWDEFVDRYQRLVWSVARSYRLPVEDCDDVTQAVLVAALRHLADLRDPAKAASWLVTSAHRESWRVARARRRTVDLVGDFASVSDPDPERAADLESLHGMRVALDALGDPCRALLVALFAENEPHYPDIARKLGMPVGSIGPTRARCLSKLRAAMGLPAEKSPQ